MTSLTIDITVDDRNAAGLSEKQIEHRLDEAMDALLVRVELMQIKKYTSSAFPARPPGSDYKRTFNLRRASKTRRMGRRLPNISGQWWIDEAIAPYGEEVMGPRSRQKAIHAGRWLSEEDITERTEQIAPALIEEFLQNG